MRSARGAREASVEDLTTRARIREAALLRFGRDGFATPLRTIAADVGVSPALVIHHFGSKDRLREACDERVLEEIRRAKQETLVGGDAGAGRLVEYLATTDQFAGVYAYVMRSLQHGGTLARAFVEHIVDDAVDYMTSAVRAGVIVPSRDERARARYLVLSSLGAALLALTLDPPEDPSDVTALMRRHYDRIGRAHV